MRKYKLVLANSFKKDYKLIKRRNYNIDLLDEVVELLLSGKKLPEKYCDQAFSQNVTVTFCKLACFCQTVF